MILSSRYHPVHPLPLDELKVGRRRKTSVLLDGVIQKNEELLRTTIPVATLPALFLMETVGSF